MERRLAAEDRGRKRTLLAALVAARLRLGGGKATVAKLRPLAQLSRLTLEWTVRST
jgi:hypothetical protein